MPRRTVRPFAAPRVEQPQHDRAVDGGAVVQSSSEVYHHQLLTQRPPLIIGRRQRLRDGSTGFAVAFTRLQHTGSA